MMSEVDNEDVRNISSTRYIELEKHKSGSCGFHLTRSKWDPYPWVSRVDPESPAQVAGIQAGECVLEVNGEDVVGKRISEIADRVRSGPNLITLLLWNSGTEPQCTSESLCCGPMPQNLQRLTACISSILSVLDCPVCLDTIPPPVYQCENGHLMCLRCRAKSERCPVCRIRLTRGRCLLAEQVYNTITDVFSLREDSEQSRKEKMQTVFKLGRKRKDVPNIKVTQSHTNKLLARLIGKSSSVDNLSNSSSKSYMQLPSTSLENNFGTNLKAKSLSTSEICKSLSPASSRNGSLLQLNASSSRQTNANLSKEFKNGTLSCHGSFESLNRKQKSETTVTTNKASYSSTNFRDDVVYRCPYTKDCSAKIKGYDVINHFKLSHNGPIIQYFKSKLRLSLISIQAQKNPCYVIHIEDLTFFLKVLDATDDEVCETGKASSLQIWIWLLEDINICNKYQFLVKVSNSEEKLLLSVTCGILSLEKVSWQSIIENQSGVYIDFNTFQVCPCNSNIFLDIEIQKNYNDNNVGTD